MPTPTPAPPLADAVAATPSLRTLGTGARQAAAGNDSRIAASISALTGDGTASGPGSTSFTLVNIPDSVTMAGSLLATNVAAPSTPASSKSRVYVDSTSKNLAVKDDAGVVKHGVQTKASVSHQFLTAISDAGVVSAAQPVAADISDATAAGQTILTSANAAAQRTALGLVIGTDVQAQDAELSAIAGLTSAANKLPYFTGSGTASLADFTSAGRALLDDADASAQRTTLGLVIGTDVQAQDAELSAIAGLVSAADRLPYFTGSGTASLTTLTSAGRALIDDADASAQRTTLGLVIGTDVQAYDPDLTAIAGLSSAADTLPYFTGSATAALATFTAAGRALVDDVDATAQRTTLGLGTMATQAASAVAITGGTITGMSAPSVSSDVATKGYVDALAVGGVSWKASVRVATTANGTLATAFANGQTVDGIVLATGDDILLKNQTTGAENGIYTVAASGAPARRSDSDTGAELVAAALFVREGTANADKAFVCTNDSITIGVTAIVFVGFVSVVGALVAANNLSDLTSAVTARTNLGLVIGTDVQAQDAELSAIAGLTSAANKLPYFTGSGTAALTDLTAAGRALIDDADASAQRTTLGLVIGTDVQAQDAELAALAGLTSAADQLPYFTGSGTAALTTLTSFGRSLIDDADASAARTTLGLVIGTDVQAQDAELSAIAGLVSAADRLPYFTGSGTASLATFTAAGRALVDDADASAQRTTLGLATVAASGSAADLSTGTLPAARLPALTGDITTSVGTVATTLGNIPTGVTMAGSLLATAIAAPSTPAAGKGLIYVDSTSKNLAVKDDAGVVKHGIRTKAAVSHSFVTAIDDDGTVTVAQPSTSDISGLGTIASQAASGVAITGGTITGITDLAIADGGTNASSAVGAYDNLSTKSTNIASASTTDLATATGVFVHVTGTVTITALGTLAAGVVRSLVFDGALILTHNATSLILPGAVNINTAAGDCATFRSEGSGNWRCIGYARAAFSPYGGATVFAGTTLNLSSSALTGDDVVVSGFADAVLINCPTSSYGICNGLAGGFDGKTIFLHNTSAFGTGPLQLTAEATSSLAANRFSSNNGTIFLYGKDAMMLRYSGANQRWEALSYPSQYSHLDNTTSPWGLLNGGGALQFSDLSLPGAFSTTPNMAGASPCNLGTDVYYDSLQLCGIKTNRRIQEALGTATASANDLTLPGWVFGNPSTTSCAGAGNTHHITGTTTINRILAGNSGAGGWQAGSKINLIFDATLILTDGAASGSNFYGMRLRGGSDREMVADSTISLIFDGTYWYER